MAKGKITEEETENLQEAAHKEDCQKNTIFWIWHGCGHHEHSAVVTTCTRLTEGGWEDKSGKGPEDYLGTVCQESEKG